jgi:ABC-type Zn uptake system ZnuABC Zn-binding protein ZnuA
MRRLVTLGLALGLALLASPAGAQDVETLRRELEQLRQQFGTTREQYQKAILILEPWGDRKVAERLAGEAGARVVPLASGVGALPHTDSYLEWMDYNVKTLAQALR